MKNTREKIKKIELNGHWEFNGTSDEWVNDTGTMEIINKINEIIDRLEEKDDK